MVGKWYISNVSIYAYGLRFSLGVYVSYPFNEVSNSISDLENNGKGANTISSITLKNNKLTLSEILAHIFNNCISDGYFPVELKDGCITPIYKGGQ